MTTYYLVKEYRKHYLDSDGNEIEESYLNITINTEVVDRNLYCTLLLELFDEFITDDAKMLNTNGPLDKVTVEKIGSVIPDFLKGLPVVSCKNKKKHK